MRIRKTFVQQFIVSLVVVVFIKVIGFSGLVQAHPNAEFTDTSSPAIVTQDTLPANSSSGDTQEMILAQGTTNSRPSLSALDREFMTRAEQSNLTEIQTSQLALQRSQNKAVRDFAQQMIEEHTNASQELGQIAQNKGFTLPTDISQDNKALLTKLQKTPSNNFNRAYMEGQVQAHSKTLKDIQNYLAKGQDPSLKPYANKMSSAVAEHLKLAQSIVSRI